MYPQVNDRLYQIQTWDARTGDIFNERVAFWLYMEDGPPIRRRWIERILLSQNPDGGWIFDRSVSRTVKQMLGSSGHDDESSPHATFLALFALVHYRELMRAAGKYPLGLKHLKRNRLTNGRFAAERWEEDERSVGVRAKLALLRRHCASIVRG